MVSGVVALIKLELIGTYRYTHVTIELWISYSSFERSVLLP